MTQENIPVIFCSACGQKNEGGANFCAKCGKQIISISTAQPPPLSTPPSIPTTEGSSQKSSGIVTALAVVGFVFGLIGMLGSFVPLIGIFAIRICVGAAVISGLSVVIALAQNAKRSFPIAALTISLIGVALIYVQINKLQSATESARKFAEGMQTSNQKTTTPRKTLLDKKQSKVSAVPVDIRTTEPKVNYFKLYTNIKQNDPTVIRKKQEITGTTYILMTDYVKRRWKAVKIEIEQKDKNEKNQYKVAMNTKFKVPNSDLTLKVGPFLPDFYVANFGHMADGLITSESSNLVDPRVYVEVIQGSKSIYDGFFIMKRPEFRLKYPEHYPYPPFQHNKYGLELVDAIPK